MNASTEWTDLVRVWQQATPEEDGSDARDLRRRVVAQSRRMSLMLALDYAFGATITCLVAWKLATDKGLDTFVWGFAVLWFTGMALQFTSDNRKGTWIPAAESTVAYLDLALERVRRREKLLRFAWALLGLQVLFLLAWYPATWFLWPLETWPLLERTPVLLGWIALVTVALALWTRVARSRIAAERSELSRIRRELATDD
jgi:multisubunit Na+/H+ antiporter MnhB subunit